GSFDRTLRVWDTATGELQSAWGGHTTVINGLAFSRDGRRLFSSGGNVKPVKIRDALTGREVLDLRGHTLYCHFVTLSPDGHRLASAGADGTIRIWDATPLKGAEGREPLPRGPDHGVGTMSCGLAGRGPLPPSTSGGTAHLRAARPGAPLPPLPRPQAFVRVYRVVFTPAAPRLAATGMGHD